ncbi:MAG: helix-hairpin-helix domain-containing protein [Bacteroidales bacterium]|nr:helix-hairpin-helix domain-containing protein [Bacteroidales bacterium]
MFRRFFIPIILVFVIFPIGKLNAQNDKAEQVIETLIEEIAANSDEELDYSTIYDDLHYFMDNPLNLNEATKGNLNKLHFLNDLQIDEIIEYRKNNGDYKTIYELQLLESFDNESIKMLLPFITVSAAKTEDKIDFNKVFKYGRHEIFTRTQFNLEPMQGYNIPDSVIQENPDKSRYLGDPMKYYVKYKFHYRDQVQWGITAEKDPGEQFFAGAQKNGFDYYSAHLQLDRIWKFKRVVIGDFQAQFGEGLALWTGMTMGKSSYVLTMKKKPQGLKKYSSADENLFLRGAGVIMEFGNFTTSAFGSYHKIDGNVSAIDTLEDIDILEVTSFQITGYHRTPSEIADRHSISQTVFGGNVSYAGKWFKTGLTFVHYNFSAELNKAIKPYQMYEFQGNSNSNLGWNYEFQYNKFHFYGETAVSQNGGLATVNGLTVPLAHQISFVTLYRNYSPAYQAYFSGAFAEGSNTFNEKGIYFGLEIYPYKNFKISSYLDSYTFPWLKYRLNSPLSNGIEYLTQIDYNPSRNVSMYIKYKREIKSENTSEDVALSYPVNKDRWSFRYHISFQINRNLTLRNRIEFSGFEKDNVKQTGFIAYQDVKFVPNKLPMSLYFRYVVFDAPYDARIYTYENDVLYAFSVPGLFYKGFRTYLVLKYDISRKLTVWGKYSMTTYTDRNIISEGGLNEVDGNTKSEIKLQLRYKF